MSIAGETIDYGPCAFMNTYDPDTVFSSIDTQGRYAYGNQPAICHWNLGCLASALLLLIDDNQEKAVEKVKAELQQFPEKFRKEWYHMMGKKTGLINPDASDKQLIDELLSIMKTNYGDYTNTFCYLTNVPVPDHSIYHNDTFILWKCKWDERIAEKNSYAEISAVMKSANPIYIPRNYLVEKALDAFALQQDRNLFDQLLTRMKNPYQYDANDRFLQEPPPNGDNQYQTFCNT
jgi:uncharacterized protein YdiU (UPF0061 family)